MSGRAGGIIWLTIAGLSIGWLDAPRPQDGVPSEPSNLAVYRGSLCGVLLGHLPRGTYRVTCDIEVPPGQTLSLAPGVVFEFESSFWSEYEFDVQGTLHAIGTEREPIIFRTAPGVKEYNYLRLAGPNSRLAWCVIENAGKVWGSDQGGLWIDSATPELSHCEVRHNAWHGVWLTGSATLPTIEDSRISNNAHAGLEAAGGAGVNAINTQFVDNGEDGVALGSGPNALVGCLVAGNGEDGVDCHGAEAFEATLVNCTVGPHPSEELSDSARFELYNSLVVGPRVAVARGEHSYLIDDVSFFRFQNPGAGDYRLKADSPVRELGTRFGLAGTGLPVLDLDGNPRINGIVDAGAYESQAPTPTGEEGHAFSNALILPRLTQPVIRTPGEQFPVWVARLGEFTANDARVTLISRTGAEYDLPVHTLVGEEMVPGSAWANRLHLPGIERLQVMDVGVANDIPADFYDLAVELTDRTYVSPQAVRILDAYPTEWQFIHITDTHVGFAGQDFSAVERLQRFVTEVNFLNPEFVVVTGDICEDQRVGNHYDELLFDALGELRVPILIVAGNHDHYTDGGNNNPLSYYQYFQNINRVRNSEFRFGDAHFFAFDTGPDLGATELFRCTGPEDVALDWAEERLASLAVDQRPRFFLTHGPTYDYFSWNKRNVDRVRALMETYDVSLALAGHTHRWETFLNEGDNWFGRNDFSHDHDWHRDVTFPGYPLHVQTSSLGKAEHLSQNVLRQQGATPHPGVLAAQHPHWHALQSDPVLTQPHINGLFGDDVGFRVIRVNHGEIDHFTADTNASGYRNTEDGWLLGELQFQLDTSAESGAITSTVTNHHHEQWTNVRHLLPGQPGMPYAVTGGTVIRTHLDGTVEVLVPVLAPHGTSVVTLTPRPAVGLRP
jgi:predicted phosphodiesterase